MGAVGIWATRPRSPSEAACPRPTAARAPPRKALALSIQDHLRMWARERARCRGRPQRAPGQPCGRGGAGSGGSRRSTIASDAKRLSARAGATPRTLAKRWPRPRAPRTVERRHRSRRVRRRHRFERSRPSRRLRFRRRPSSRPRRPCSRPASPRRKRARRPGRARRRRSSIALPRCCDERAAPSRPAPTASRERVRADGRSAAGPGVVRRVDVGDPPGPGAVELHDDVALGVAEHRLARRHDGDATLG